MYVPNTYNAHYQVIHSLKLTIINCYVNHTYTQWSLPLPADFSENWYVLIRV